MYWQNEERFLSAEESMALQGIFAKDFKKSRGFFEKKRSAPKGLREASARPPEAFFEVSEGLRGLFFACETRSLCNDMAGNAFSMSVCSAVLQAVLITLASKEY